MDAFYEASRDLMAQRRRQNGMKNLPSLPFGSFINLEEYLMVLNWLDWALSKKLKWKRIFKNLVLQFITNLRIKATCLH